jgi:thiol-disulfide isomerase/thioredoxin
MPKNESFMTMSFLPKMMAGVLAALLLTGVSARADEATYNAEMAKIHDQIQKKLDAGKKTEADFSQEFEALDSLIATEDSQNTNHIATAWYLKGQIYLLAIDDPEKSQAIFKKISVQYPTFELASDAGHKAEALETEVAAKRIRDSLVPGTAFPDFAEHDLAGNSLSVSNYPGKVVFVDFWATWCPKCMVEMPSVIKFNKSHHEQGLQIIGICANKAEEESDLKTYLKKNPDMDWPQYYDGQWWQNKLVVKYGVDATPFNIIIGRDGKIAAVNVHDDDLEKALTKALKQK